METTAKNKLRIFLSYGHDKDKEDKNEELVDRIRDDLRSLGYEVWIDKDIPPGEEWDREVTTAILNSDLVVAFLSKRSMREKGVCLNELTIAEKNGRNIKAILVENKNELPDPLPSVVRQIRDQWITMHDWKEQQAKGTEAWDNYYKNKLSEITRMLKNSETQNYATENEDLRHYLAPIFPDVRIKELLKDWVAERKWLFEEVEKWWSDPEQQTQRIYWLTGEPGMGKSTFAAKLAETHSAVVAKQFTKGHNKEHRGANQIIRNLAYQLASRVSHYRTQLLDKLSKLAKSSPEQSVLDQLKKMDPDALFNDLLVEPLHGSIDGGHKQMLIVLDALDETGDALKNPFVEMLARNVDCLPEWLRFVITSRPDSAVTTPLQGWNRHEFDNQKEANRDDLRKSILVWLDEKLSKRPDADSLINQILDNSRDVILYVKHFCEAVRLGHISLDHPEKFPEPLGGVYARWMERVFPDVTDEDFINKKQPALCAILAAITPLPVATLQRMSGWRETELNNFTIALGSLFPINEDTQTIESCHSRLTDWLTDKPKAGKYFMSVMDGHRTLAESGWQQFQAAPETMDDYFLQWLPRHLLAYSSDGILPLKSSGGIPAAESRTSCQRQDAVATLIELLKDFRYMMERTKRGMLERLLADYRELPAPYLRASAPLRENPGKDTPSLDIETFFFREKAHILRRGTADWPPHKILLQLAIEHADDSPLTQGAERWLEDNRCDWLWLRRELRLPRAQKNPCIAVLEGHTGSIRGAFKLHDGHRLLSWAADCMPRIWNGLTGEPLAVLKGHSDKINGALELYDKRILSWSDDKTLRIWDGVTGKQIFKMKGHNGPVTDAFELINERLLSWSGKEKTLLLWDGQNGTQLTTLTGHQAMVRGAVKLSNNRILSWSWDNTLRIWNGLTGEPLAVLEGHTALIEGALEVDEERILSWSDDKTLRLWSGENGNQLAMLAGHSLCVNGALKLSGGQFLSWSDDKTLRRWDGQTGESLAVLQGHKRELKGALELRDGRILSWGESEGPLRLWDWQSGEEPTILKGNGKSDYGSNGVLELSNNRLLSCERGKNLRLWDLRGNLLVTLTGHVNSVNGALELSKGRILSWSYDGTLRLWDSQTNEDLERLESHDNCVDGILNLNEKQLLSWCMDGKLRIWDCQTGKSCAELGPRQPNKDSKVRDVLMLRNRQLLSRSEETTLQIWEWDGEKGKKVAELKDPSNIGFYGALELDGNRLLTTSKDQDKNKTWLTERDLILLKWELDRRKPIWEPILQKDSCYGHIKDVVRLSTGQILLYFECALLLWDERSQNAPVELWSQPNRLKKRRRCFIPCTCAELGGWQNNKFVGVLGLRDGRFLSWSADAILRIWDGKTREPLTMLKGHTGKVTYALELSNGRILSWSADATLRIWDGQTGRQLVVLAGHTDNVREALELRDGQILSRADDKTLRLWDGGTGNCLEVVHEKQVATLHPEWRWEQAKTKTPQKVEGNLFCIPSEKPPKKKYLKGWEWAQLRHKDVSPGLAVWQAESEAVARCLLADGTLVVTQQNGQVCFLKLYHGNRRVLLTEAEGIVL